MGNETAGFANAQQDETPQEGVNNSIVETIGEQAEAVENQEATGENAVKDPKDFELFEAQDKMIEETINVISHRFNALIDFIRKHKLDVESGFRSEQRKFTIKISQLH